MSILVGATSACAGAAGQGGAGFTIDQSARFHDTQRLTRTFANNSGNTWTWSAWLKKTSTSISDRYIFGTVSPLLSSMVRSNSFGWTKATIANFESAKRRDPSAWYHRVDVSDGTDLKLYINGVLVQTWSSASTGINTNVEHFLGGDFASRSAAMFQGYMAQVHFIDGTAVSDTGGVIDEFGQYNDDGVWIPQDYTGTYGNNGFKLTFDSSQANGIGHDSSGNDNHWTASGFDTAAISSSNFDNDIDYNDTPTSNYATLNPLSPSAGTLTEANLHATSSSVGSTPNVPATIRNVTSGDWYFEFDGSNGNTIFGIVPGDNVNYPLGDPRGNGTPAIWFGPNTVFSGISGVSAMSLSPSVTSTNHIQSMRVNIDNEEVTFYGEGTDQGTYTFAQLNTNLQVNLANQPLSFFATPILSNEQVNYGQRPFVHRPSGLTDTGNLQTNNLPEPTIKNGKEHFGILTYAAPASPSFPITIDGSGGNNGDGELDFDGQPDLVWIKMRNAGQNHTLFDSVRGTSVSIRPDGTNSEISRTNFAFATNGFTFSAQDAESYQQNDNYVAWCWKAGTSYTPTVTGFTSPSASINTEAGFGIYKFTGNNTASSFTHGLASTPELIIAKNLTSAFDWAVFPPRFDGPPTPTDTYLRLNEQFDANKGGTQILTGNTSTTVSVDSFGETASNDDYVYYLWHSVEGFSKIGRYLGNGSSDGVFVYCGFRPAFVMVKGVTTTNGWGMYDNTRFENNPVNGLLYANSSSGESSFVNRPMDFLSNGFKCRDGNTNLNASTSYMFMAFAENPFGGENAPPATAR